MVVSKEGGQAQRFLAVDVYQMSLVEPETKRLGWGVVKFAGLLQVRLLGVLPPRLSLPPVSLSAVTQLPPVLLPSTLSYCLSSQSAQTKMFVSSSMAAPYLPGFNL